MVENLKAAPIWDKRILISFYCRSVQSFSFTGHYTSFRNGYVPK